MDAYLKRFVDFCKEYFQNNLLAIVLYGSRAEGYYSKHSDYDLFIIVRNKRKEKEFRKTLKKFRKIRLPYFQDTIGLWKLIREGHWSVYFALSKTGKIIYSTLGYTRFKNKLKNYKPNKSKIKKRYTTLKYKYELKEAQKLMGYNFAKWVYYSIRKRLYFISYLRFDKTNFDFLRDLTKNKDLFSQQELKKLKLLHGKAYERNGKLNKKQRKDFLDLFKKLTNFS